MPSDEAAAFVDARFRELIAPGERTLGLLCRGTDYFTKRPYKHQIQPTVAQIIEKTDETLAAHPVDKIFVATEDEAILAALKAKYGGKLVYVECPRLTAVQGQSVAEGFAERGVDRKLNGLYYFASIAILARCDHLIAGKTMATQFIRTMRDTPFETEFYWDLGYGVDESAAGNGGSKRQVKTAGQTVLAQSRRHKNGMPEGFKGRRSANGASRFYDITAFFHGHGGGAPPGFGKAQPSVQRERGRVIRRNLHGADGKAARLHGGKEQRERRRGDAAPAHRP